MTSELQADGLLPSFTGRGFARWPKTLTSYGSDVEIYESSAAGGPHIWLRIEQPAPQYAGQPDQAEAFAHMTLAQAEVIYPWSTSGEGVMFYSQQKRSCAGKRAYVTIGECERAIRALKSQWRGNRHRVVHPYRCRECQAFHLSSMERGEHEERKIQHKRFYAAIEPA